MRSYRIAILWAFLLFIAGAASGHAAERPPLKALFIGNSYTSVNDLPSLVAGLAAAGGGRRIEVDRHLVGACTFERHVKETKALEKIREQKWNVVVLQEQSLQPILGRDKMFEYARILHRAIQKQGATTVFYLTWARQDIPQMQGGADPAASPEYAQAMYKISGLANPKDFESWRQQHAKGLSGGLSGAYFTIAKELNAAVAPVGVAWYIALKSDARRVLHRADKSHPTPSGSYLAACVFYATLLGKSPVGLPGEIKNGSRALVQIAPEEAKRLQDIAWQTVLATKPLTTAFTSRTEP
jgi:hypothetical protein